MSDIIYKYVKGQGWVAGYNDRTLPSFTIETVNMYTDSLNRWCTMELIPL